jgi:hypothetical protein
MPSKRSFSFATTLVVTVVLAAAVGTAAAEAVPPHLFGRAVQVTVNGKPSPVWRLSVVTAYSPWTWGAEVAQVQEVGTEELLASQLDSQEKGLLAACDGAGKTDVIAMDDIKECQHPKTLPAIGVSGPTRGFSSGLAEALVVAFTLGDFFGEYEVAATGQVTIDQIRYEGAVIATEYRVSPIGGAPQKAAAAALAGVDILVVPIGNYQEFAANKELAEAGVQILAVGDVRSALIAVCAETQTAMCKERVLIAE